MNVNDIIQELIDTKNFCFLGDEIQSFINLDGLTINVKILKDEIVLLKPVKGIDDCVLEKHIPYFVLTNEEINIIKQIFRREIEKILK